MSYPSLYRAKAVSIKSGVVEAFVPQVFGESTITITDALGALPTAPTMGWVFFQAGNPEFPVWSAGVSAVGGGSSNGNGGVGVLVDEVWISPDEPTDENVELWYDTDEPHAAASLANWQTLVTNVEMFTIGASQALTQNQITGHSLTYSSGAGVVAQVVSSTTLSGWYGPNPIQCVKLTKPGLYFIEGTIVYNSVLAQTGASGILSVARQNGGSLAANAVRGTTYANMPVFFNSYGFVRESFEVLDATDVCIFLGSYTNEAGKATYTSGGTLNVKCQSLGVAQAAGDDAALARWNSAWGVVGKGAFIIAHGGTIPLNVSTPIAATTATIVSGRRYLLKLWLNGLLSATPITVQWRLFMDGAEISGFPHKWVGGQNDSALIEWPIPPVAGTPSPGSHTFEVRALNTSTPTGTVYTDQAFFDCFDVGPLVPAAATPPAGQTPVVAAGKALGIVAVGSFINQQAPYTLPAATTVAITNQLPFTTIVGRRYRLVARIRVVGSTGTAGHFNWFARGSGLPSTDGWDASLSQGYTHGSYEIVFNGTGVPSNYYVEVNSPVVTQYFWLNGEGVTAFYLEDVGPNTSPALPIPETPAPWQSATLLNGWYVTAGDQPAQYRKVGDMVHVRGYLKHANVTAQGNVIILPPGFRPPYYIPVNVAYYFGTPPSNYSITSLGIQTDGRVGYDGAKTTIGFMTFDFQFSVTP